MSSEEQRASRRTLSRREFLRLASVGSGAAFLAACGGAPATSTDTTAVGVAEPTAEAVAAVTEVPAPTAIVVAEGQTKITWWNSYSSESVKQVVPLMMKDFEGLYPNIKIEYELSGGAPGGGNYAEVLLARIASGTPPDVSTLYTTPAEFAARGSLQDIDSYMSSAKWAKPDAFFPGPLGSCQWQGKTYGLPSSAGAGAIYYNTEKFKEKGITMTRDTFPKTWDELQKLSGEFVVKEGETITEIGMVPWGDAWLNSIWSGNNGGQLYDAANNRYTLNTDQNVEWLTFWTKWLDEQLGGNYEQLTIAGNWPGAYQDRAFWQKKAAMTIEGSWVSTDAEIPFNWEVAKLPVGPSGSKSMTGYWPNWWVLPKGTQHPAEAFQFVEYIATKGWEIWYRGIMDTPAWKEFPKDVLTTKLVEQVGEERARDVNGFFADYLNDSVPMWNSPIESFANDTIAAMLEQVLNKAKEPRAALEEAQGICQAKLDETMQS